MSANYAEFENPWLKARGYRLEMDKYPKKMFTFSILFLNSFFTFSLSLKIHFFYFYKNKVTSFRFSKFGISNIIKVMNQQVFDD